MKMVPEASTNTQEYYVFKTNELYVLVGYEYR